MLLNTYVLGLGHKKKKIAIAFIHAVAFIGRVNHGLHRGHSIAGIAAMKNVTRDICADDGFPVLCLSASPERYCCPCAEDRGRYSIRHWLEFAAKCSSKLLGPRLEAEE